MLKPVVGLGLLLTLTACDSDIFTTFPPEDPDPSPPTMAQDKCYTISTNLGAIAIAVDMTNTPVTGKNFARYVDDGFYNGTIFHRVIYNFMSQSGGYTKDLVAKPTRAPIINEAKVGFRNLRGTLAMARFDNSPNSADSQFFINALDNPQLDASASSAGYAVFGQVIAGMDVVDQINIVRTTTVGAFTDVPVTHIVISNISPRSCR